LQGGGRSGWSAKESINKKYHLFSIRHGSGAAPGWERALILLKAQKVRLQHGLGFIIGNIRPAAFENSCAKLTRRSKNELPCVSSSQDTGPVSAITLGKMFHVKQ
jgi:hypothetical protein